MKTRILYTGLMMLIIGLSCTKEKTIEPESYKIQYLIHGDKYTAYINYPDGSQTTHISDTTDVIKYFDNVDHTSVYLESRKVGMFDIYIIINDVVMRDTTVWLPRGWYYELEYYSY